MSANCFSSAVADEYMQVGSVFRKSAGKAYNFKMAAASAAFRLVGETDVVIRKAAGTGIYPSCFNLLFIY